MSPRLFTGLAQAGGAGSGLLASAVSAARKGRDQGGGNQPLSSSDFDVSLPREVGGPRLVRPEVGDLAKPVLMQQLCYLTGEEPADERLAHLRGEPGEGGRDLRGAAGQRGRRLVVSEHDTGCRAGIVPWWRAWRGWHRG